MTMKFLAQLASAVLLLASVPAMANGTSADVAGNEVQSLPCAEDPFCQREAWDAEFERICAQTGVATALDATQLQKLISDSDELLPRLESLPPDKARLYSFRLKSCRSFFVYALQLLELKTTD